jgi:hypothetical protein
MVFNFKTIKTMKKYLVLFAVLVLFWGCSEDNCTDPDDYDYTKIKIVGLFDLSGENSGLGTACKDAVRNTVSDLKAQYEAAGLPKDIELVIEDTQSDSEKSLEIIKRHYTEGNTVFIGPEDDASISAVEKYVKSKNIFLISCGSTSLEYAEKDNIIRLSCNDGIESEALAYLMKRTEIDAIVPCYADNMQNREYYANFKETVSGFGKDFSGSIFTPVVFKISDAETETVSKIRAKMIDAVDKYPTGNVAILYLNSENSDNIFSKVVEDKLFFSVKWFGNSTLLSFIEKTQNSLIKEFASEVELTVPKVAVNVNYLDDVYEEDTDFEVLACADASNILVNSMAKVYKGDISVLKSLVESESQKYFGYTGNPVLDKNGDREFGVIDFHRFSETGNSKVGTYDSRLNVIE